MIENITYHILHKEQGTTENVRIEINPEVLNVSDTSHELLNQLIDRYRGKAGKGYGKFEEDVDNFPISTILENYLNEDHSDDFAITTERLMNVLKARSESQAGAKGGKIAFIHYTEANEDYFLIALLTEKTGVMAKDWNLTLDEFLNIDNMRFAGRINLNEWQDVNCDKRYISFLKGQGNVSDYFRRFMGCNDAVMANFETKNLVTFINDFATEQGMDLNERKTLSENAKSYLSQMSEENEPFILQTFANNIWSENPQVFIDSIERSGEENSTSISDGFIPHKTALRRLTVFTHKTQHWSMSFDATAIQNEDVRYENGNIILSNPPSDLIAAFGANNTE